MSFGQSNKQSTSQYPPGAQSTPNSIAGQFAQLHASPGGAPASRPQPQTPTQWHRTQDPSYRHQLRLPVTTQLDQGLAGRSPYVAPYCPSAGGLLSTAGRCQDPRCHCKSVCQRLDCAVCAAQKYMHKNKIYQHVLDPRPKM